MDEKEKNEKDIRGIVKTAIRNFAANFLKRHLSQVDDVDGVINTKINNTFIAALKPETQFYSALSRSLDSSLGNMIEKMAIKIAGLSYAVEQKVEGTLYDEQIDFIAELLESYKRDKNRVQPLSGHYCGITNKTRGIPNQRTHKSDYHLYDRENKIHYLIELKIGGDLDNKKARSEKEALLEQYCILANQVGESSVKILFATAYNRFGEGKPWRQERVLQFFSEDELCISRDFWNLVCRREDGYDIVIDEYRRNAHYINDALAEIKKKYLH